MGAAKRIKMLLIEQGKSVKDIATVNFIGTVLLLMKS